MERRKLELYVHIPFCVCKCSYCDFLSIAAFVDPQDPTRLSKASIPHQVTQLHREYVSQLIREIQCQSAICKDEYEVDTIFIGGGTPSILETSLMESVMGEIGRCFAIRPDAEVTIECNPGTVSRSKLSAYRQCGINRISFGLQSADNRELRELGRIHTYEDFLDSYQMARQAGFANINVDLMSALPGQNLKSWEKTLKKVLLLRPEHISAYSLIIEEGTPFYERYGHPKGGQHQAMRREERAPVPAYETSRGRDGELIRWPKLKVPDYSEDESGGNWLPLPDEDTERQMYQMTRQLLEEHGMKRYEISNYARKGLACRHNIGYWTGVEYLGLGLGSSSCFVDCRFSNERDLGRYLRVDFTKGMNEHAIRVLRQGYEELTETDRMEEFMFLGLRLMEGVSVADFYRRFGHNIFDVYGEVIRSQIEMGLLENRQGFLALTDWGIDVSNQVMAQYLL